MGNGPETKNESKLSLVQFRAGNNGLRQNGHFRKAQSVSGLANLTARFPLEPVVFSQN
jgi:hypothetical protein